MPKLTLRPMSAKECEAFCATNKANFARERMKADYQTLSQATEVVEKKYRTLLPNGQKTPNHYFYKLADENAQLVGDVWLFVDPGTQEGFLYMIQIEASFRGKGLGKRQWKPSRVKVASLGHVFSG